MVKRFFIALVSVSAFAVLIFALVGCSITISDGAESDFIYTMKEDGTYSVAASNSFNVENLVIPKYYDYTAVTEIAEDGFRGRSSIKTVVVPDSITVIGKGAFADCYELQEITVPFVGACADADDSCNWFGYIFGAKIPDENINFVPKKLCTVTVTGGRAVARKAFWRCENLTAVNLPNTVKSIGAGAFGVCSALTSLTVPKGVETIGWCAFADCSALTDITLPFVGGEKNGSDNAFFGYIFGASSALKQYADIPASLQTVTLTDCNVLPSQAFYKCDYLKEINLPDGLTFIGSGAFWGCRYLRELVIPNSVVTIEADILTGCSSVRSITAPFIGEKRVDASCTYLGYWFGAPSVDMQANYVSALLTKLTVTDCARIGGLSGCDMLVEVILPDNLTVIEERAFFGCSSLKKIEVPEGVAEIGKEAFCYCSALTVVKLPETLRDMNDLTFAHCKALTDIYFGGTVTQWRKEIRRGSNWRFDVPSLTLRCSDQTVENYKY